MATGLLAGKRIVWAPQAGSQTLFLSCPVFECLYEGTRGPGKTDALLMDFAREVGRGFGAAWRGVLFRQTYPQLADVIAKSKKWFHQIFPDAKYNESKTMWTWGGGEALLLRHMAREDDYWNYHGHEYPWIGWEELTNWSDDRCYTVMMSCSRSSTPGMPRRYRSTTNPYGPGHNWVKRRWRLPSHRGRIIKGEVRVSGREPDRVAIHGSLHENKVLLRADPDYIGRISAAARNNSERKAWLEGSWDIVAGGMFDDLWELGVHVLPRIPAEVIPRGWRIDRSFDWGSSKPFSVGWWAQSNGEPIVVGGRRIGAVRGDLIRIKEWYGCGAKPNEGVQMLASDIAEGIRDREEDWGLRGRVRPGPADSSIFDVENGNSVAVDMEKKGVRWEPADKRPGSRKQGWEQLRKMLKASFPNASGAPRETPGLFVTQECTHFIELVPVLPRSDKDLDDVDTDAEDHIGDEARYRVRRDAPTVKRGKF